MKKVWIVLIVGMFIISMLPGIVGENETAGNTFQAKKFIETRKVIPIFTEHGFQRTPNSKGKPGVYVIIIYPTDGQTVSGTVIIEIDSNENPTIKIDGGVVGNGLTYNWDTTSYSNGAHTIEASAKGNTDNVVVTVNNGGGNTPPVVTITTPSDGATVSGTIPITVDAIDAEDGTLTADIYIDGGFVANSNSYSWDTTSYSDGGHTLYAEASDSGGLTDSDSITVTVDNGANPVEKYALVIGISDYEGTGNDLQYCDDDAMDWKNFLQGEGYTVTLLTDNQATANNIDAAVNDLLVDEDGNDYVVLTYSGHGVSYPGYGSCVISHDLYYMTHGWLEQKFDSSDSPHIYFAFDACQIGDFKGLVDNNKVGAFASNRRFSYDGDATMKNGVFTYYQMDGWDNQNFDNFEDDGDYAVQQMKSWARNYGIRVDPFVKDVYNGPMMP
ncbi:hypothetical protein AYK25_02410 [Thermoplasmatales archaeon SM1-50]|nr:MAG: hypothetical protein AYK25_02410 [Thermoplasmatales archaeon SM1-50]